MFAIAFDLVVADTENIIRQVCPKLTLRSPSRLSDSAFDASKAACT
jgi:hypothetical protein